MSDSPTLPGENLPGKETQPIPEPEPKPLTTHNVPPPVTEPSTTQPPKNMEVHAHGHVHHDAKWKDYLFQFILLFLAVFLGFWADSFRENGEERHKEKEYVESLIVDLQTDSAIIDKINSYIVGQIKDIETLQDLFYSPVYDSATISACYDYSTTVQNHFAINFTERTITQLLSSGNMRLINREVADSITDYFNFIKAVDLQKEIYINYIYKCLESMYKVYDITYLRTKISGEKPVYAFENRSNIALGTNDPAELKRFVSTLEVTKLMTNSYSIQLDMIKNKATLLISYLRQKYGLKAEKLPVKADEKQGKK